jgi:hypothetical protein
MKQILLRTVMGVAVSLVAIASASPALADSFDFSGDQLYWTYAVKTKEILQNGPCEVTATLDFVGGKDVVLAIFEACPGAEPRFYPLFGKMTRSGSLKLSFPDFIPIVEIVKEHTGCTVVGPFPKYQGMFRDGVLHAETHFYSQCNVHWPDNDIFDTPVDGPVHWKWTLHLELTP